MFRIEKRPARSPFFMRLLSVFAALAVAGLMIAACGYNPFTVYAAMLKGSFGTEYYVQQMIQQMIPLTIMAIGSAVCFKMKFMNIGADGQFYMGAIAATYIALNVNGISPSLKLVLMFASAFAAGGLWCLIAGVLKMVWHVSETLITLMLNYVAIKLVSYLQYVLWKDPKSFGFPKIANYPTEVQLPNVAGVHAGWIIAIVIVIFAGILFYRTRLGYEITVMGANHETARYVGMNITKIILVTALISGGICGLAGVIQSAGVEHTLNDQMGGGMGYTAVAIAYMADMKPVAIVVISFLFSVLLQGSDYMQVALQIPSATGQMIQGILLLFILGSDFFMNYRFVKESRLRGRKK